MEQRIDPTTVTGWGIDADPENDPAYPMRHTTEDRHAGLDYERPPQQDIIEDLHSNERPNMTAVYGTSMTPTSGFSGVLRRKAFNFSEDSYKHWLILIAADRVNVVEGVIDDLSHGHIPNIFAEKGWKAQWKYAPQKVIGKTVAIIAATTILILLARRRRSSHT